MAKKHSPAYCDWHTAPVIDSRVKNGVRARIRKCDACGTKYHTEERVVRLNGRRVAPAQETMLRRIKEDAQALANRAHDLLQHIKDEERE